MPTEKDLPGVPELDRIRAARRFLASRLPETRLVPARGLGAPGSPVLLKLESEQPTGSFKVRGALWALSVLHREEPVAEVVASSTGNHGAAVAWAADRLGIRATIFLPEAPNPVKRARIDGAGARVVEGGRDLAEAYQAAVRYAEERGAYLLNDATDAELPAGPGTIALEVLDRVPEVARIVVPVGDTALIRGVAAGARALRPGIRIVGVQAEEAPAYTLSWREGRPVPTERCDTVAGGLATRTPEPDNVAAIRALVDDFVLVSDAELDRAVERLLLEEHLVAEPAGAAALAGFLRLEGAASGPTVLLVSGANLSRDDLRRIAGSAPDGGGPGA